MSEADEMRRQMKLATSLEARLFRNNVGQAWTGSRIVKNKDGSITIHNPRPFHGGLCAGSGDLIGWVPVKITSGHVGQTLAVFASVEVKTGKGRATQKQKDWAAAVVAAGGRAGISRNDEGLKKILSGQD